ncbi:MAG: hypothetical protein K0S80_5339 [Neobacillus sp.]|nr:hypothetical protein [Neobacillus sp.]
MAEETPLGTPFTMVNSKTLIVWTELVIFFAELPIERICELPVKTEQLEALLDKIYCEYHMKNQNGNINSALYCEMVIKSILVAEKKGIHV